MELEFRLLGPVEVWSQGKAVNAGEPRRRAVLAALLFDAGRIVPSTTLIDRVWGERPPEHAHRTLTTHITRLRRVMEQAAGGDEPPQVLSQPGGYRLVVDRARVDLHRFRHLLDAQRDPQLDDQERVESLREAVGLWHGDPLTGISGDWACRTRGNLIAERLTAMAAWAEAELRVGNATGVLAELGEHAEQHPLMEPLTVMLMRALVAAGRPSEALERCRVHRQRLADEQGTDQGPEIRALYDAILRGDVDLLEPVTAAPHRTTVTAGGPPGPAPAPAPAPAPPPAPAPAPAEVAPPVPSMPQKRLGGARRGAVIAAVIVVAVLGLSLAAVDAARRHAVRAAPAGPSAAATIVDDFTGPDLDRSKWSSPYEQQRQNGSTWSPSAVRTVGGELQIAGVGRNPTGRGNVAGGLCWCHDPGLIRRYGIWKVRAKFDAGAGYGPMIGLFPDGNEETEGWLTTARVDQPARNNVYAELRGREHTQVTGSPTSGDFTGWTTYAIEWRADFVRITVDDATILDTRTIPSRFVVPSAPMYLYLQLVPGPDGPVPAPTADTPSQVAMHVDWVSYTG